MVENENARWRNSELGEFLASNSPVPLEALSQWCDFYHMWEFISEALREQAPNGGGRVLRG